MKTSSLLSACALFAFNAAFFGCDSAPSSPSGVGMGGGIATGGSANAGGVSNASGGATNTTGGADPFIDAGPPLSGSVTISGKAPKSISSAFQGVNYWSWVVQYGNQVTGTEQLVRALKPGLMRVGGTNADNSSPEAYSNAVIETAVAYARSIGAEPLIQVPVVKDANGNVPTAAGAASLVQYLNVTKSLGVKYFSIGNEPDLYTDNGSFSSYSAEVNCQTFAAFADAMKQADPSIRIIGPDYSWKYQPGTVNDWLTPFIDACQTKVDIVAVHRYPIDPAQVTEDRAMADPAAFRSTLRNLRSLLDTHGMASAPLAITEYNITWDGDPAKSTMEASPGTFAAALWTADVHGVALEEQLWSFDYWSISEGWTLGMLNGKSPRPAYYALKLYADHFGANVLTTTGAPSGVAVYASRNQDNTGTSAIVVNWNANDYDLSVTFTDFASPPPATNLTAKARSISAFEVLDSGTTKGWVYTQALAKAGKAPIEL